MSVNHQKRANIWGGQLMLTPNEVSNGSGFYVSYNGTDISIYGCETTALVVGQMQHFYILNGDHRKAYAPLVDAGFEACLNYFKSQRVQINIKSDKLDQSNSLPQKLFHATAMSKLDEIHSTGLNPHAYFASNEDISRYYMETVADDGEVAVLLIVKADNLDARQLSPDIAGIEEPITTVLKTSEEAIHKLWQASNKTWEDSNRIIGSVRYDARIPSTAINVDFQGNEIALSEFLNIINRRNSLKIKV